MGGMLRKVGVVGALGAALMLSACSAGNSGKTELTFQIWDTAQRDGMQALIDAYVAEHPDVEIKLQVTSWDEYWTKMDAAAESNQLPDIFWMHTNEILKYTKYGMLEDVTNLYDDVDPNYYAEHFSEIALNNAKGADGRIYGVPKDKDTVCLVYNKEMFDAAGVSYPDESWTWDTLVEASQQIYDATGKYGYMAYADDQLGYWNFVYQAGGQILTDDKSKGDFLNPGTKKGIEFYVGLQDYEWCPDQNYFAQTNPGTAFFSEQGAMYFEGNWNLLSQLQIVRITYRSDSYFSHGIRGYIRKFDCHNRKIIIDVCTFYLRFYTALVNKTDGQAGRSFHHMDMVTTVGSAFLVTSMTLSSPTFFRLRNLPLFLSFCISPSQSILQKLSHFSVYCETISY